MNENRLIYSYAVALKMKQIAIEKIIRRRYK